MFNRPTPPIPVDSTPVSVRRRVEIPSESGIDVVYTDSEESLPPFDAFSIESLSAAGIPLQTVNPAVLDSIDVRSVEDFISKQFRPASSVSKPAASDLAASDPDVPQPVET